MGIESKSWKMLRNFIDYSEEQIEEIRRKQREAHRMRVSGLWKRRLRA
jgi:hypothetical protein